MTKPYKKIEQGWECPKCGSVMAQWMPNCNKCSGIKMSISEPNMKIAEKKYHNSKMEPKKTKNCKHKWAQPSTRREYNDMHNLQVTFTICEKCAEEKIIGSYCLSCQAPYPRA